MPKPEPALSRERRMSAAPLFHRVYLKMAERLDSGHYGPGTAIPTEAELAVEFGVSRITVRRAVLDLADEGRLDRYRGRGTFVADTAPARPGLVRQSLERQLEQTALDTKVRVVDLSYVPAPADVGTMMALAPGSTVQYSRRLRLRDGVPSILLDAYVPEALGRKFTSRDLRKSPLHLCLEAAGAKLCRVVQSFSGSVAGPEDAKLLEVPFGVALGQIERVGYDQNDQTIQFLRILFVPSRVKMRMEISSEDGERADAGQFIFS